VEHLRAEASHIYDACGAHGMGQLAGGFVRAHTAFMK
jgi:hypothetical protein